MTKTRWNYYLTSPPPPFDGFGFSINSCEITLGKCQRTNWDRGVSSLFLSHRFHSEGSGYMTIAPFWLTIPWVFEVPSLLLILEIGSKRLLWILRNLALQVASVLLQVLSRDVIRRVNGSLKQRHFPGPEFYRPISVLSRGSIHHGYGRLCLALQQPAIIAPSRSRGPRALWLRRESSFS